MKPVVTAALVLVMALAIALLGWDMAPAQASPCRLIEGQQVCLVDLQRSAKNYWDYRTVLRIDGKTQPAVTYNCRDRTQTNPDGTVRSFQSPGIGAWICRLFRR